MKYRAKRLNKNSTKFYCGEDIELTYFIVDEEDNIVNNLSNFTFVAKLYSDGDNGSDFDQATYMTVSGSKLTLTIPNSVTTSFEYNQRYVIEIQGTVGTTVNTLIRDEIYFLRELI